MITNNNKRKKHVEFLFMLWEFSLLFLHAQFLFGMKPNSLFYLVETGISIHMFILFQVLEENSVLYYVHNVLSRKLIVQ